MGVSLAYGVHTLVNQPPARLGICRKPSARQVCLCGSRAVARIRKPSGPACPRASQGVYGPQAGEPCRRSQPRSCRAVAGQPAEVLVTILQCFNFGWGFQESNSTVRALLTIERSILRVSDPDAIPSLLAFE